MLDFGTTNPVHEPDYQKILQKGDMISTFFRKDKQEINPQMVQAFTDHSSKLNFGTQLAQVLLKQAENGKLSTPNRQKVGS